MKISARTCNTPVQEKKPEPDLEFYLEECSHFVKLKVRDKSTGFNRCGNVLSIKKKDGRLIRYTGIAKDYGLPLSISGQLLLENDK